MRNDDAHSRLLVLQTALLHRNWSVLELPISAYWLCKGKAEKTLSLWMSKLFVFVVGGHSRCLLTPPPVCVSWAWETLNIIIESRELLTGFLTVLVGICPRLHVECL